MKKPKINRELTSYTVSCWMRERRKIEALRKRTIRAIRKLSDDDMPEHIRVYLVEAVKQYNPIFSCIVKRKDLRRQYCCNRVLNYLIRGSDVK